MSFPRYPKYKDSGVEWLGKVPEHWGVGQSRRLFALRNEPALDSDKQLTASQKHGILFQADYVEAEGRRVVEVIKGMESLKHVEPNDFVISMRSFQGGIEWSTLRGSISWHYVMLVPVKDVYPPFFAYLLKSLTYIQALRSTTDLIRDGQELRFSHFVQVDLPLIPIDEQTFIAAFLDEQTANLDRLILEQQRLIELLKEKRQAVISHAVTKGLNPDAPMKPSGIEWLGDVPAHWEAKRFHRCVEVAEGQVDPEDPLYSALPLIAPNHIESGTGRLLDLESASDQGAESGKYRCRAGDVVYSKIRPGLRKVCVAPTDCLCSADMYPLRAHSGLINPFLLWSILSEQFSALAVLESQRVAMPKINRESLKEVTLAVPPTEEQREIVKQLDKTTAGIDALMIQTQRAIDLLQERRTALISAAVTGQIDVRGFSETKAARASA